jgi:poly(A) polymerase
MPIITPAYPAMCATHNVTASTQMVMTEEFKKGLPGISLLGHGTNASLGADIVDKVIVGSADWSELFLKHDFFHKYRYYLQIIASTGDHDLQIKWYIDFHSFKIFMFFTS